MIVYLKMKLGRVEIKTAVTGYEFKFFVIMFVDDGKFLNIWKITDSQWYEVL